MGQKVNPHGLRVGVIKTWSSRWYAKDEVFGDTLVSDYNLRKYLKTSLYDAGISHIDIERDAQRVRIFVYAAKPGLVLGKGGEELKKYQAACEKMVGKPVLFNINEVKQPDLDAQLVAENIAKQLENRVAFRRAMKMAIRNTMRLGAKGIKVNCSGRLAGAEIARGEHYHEGTIPLQTIRADIDYGFAEANTTYGKIGVKAWIYKGEILQEVNRPDQKRDHRDNRGNRNYGDKKDNRGNRSFGDRKNGNNGANRPFRGGERKERTPKEGGAN